jgi:hypothetical protein
MARIMAHISTNQADADQFADKLSGSLFGYVQSDEPQGKSGYTGNLGLTHMKISRQRWALAGRPKDKLSFSHVWKILRAPIADAFYNSPTGYLGWIASGGGDIKEIVFVPSGVSHGTDTPNTHKGVAGWGAVTLLAFHQSFAVMRAIKKVDSIVWNKGWPVATAPLDLVTWIEDETRKGLNLNARPGRGDVNL